MRTVLVFRERILPPSETFILGQSDTLQGYRPVLVGLHRVRPSLDPHCAEVLLMGTAGPGAKLVSKFYRAAPFAPGFFRRLRAERPSIIHAHFATDAVQALPIAEALGLPLVVSLHGYDVTTTEAHFRKTFGGRRYLKRQARLFARASRFLCVSKAIREAALRAGFPEAKLQVHYTGVDTMRFLPGMAKPNPKLVLFVGRLVEKKGCAYLLRAMRLVQKEDAEACLEVIGDGPLRKQLEAEAKSLGVRAHFRGVQDTDEVRRSMVRARVLCNPSVTAASGDSEGFGMVFAEAQAVGTPVVSSLHPAISEAVKHGETGLLCPERNHSDLAAALLTFLRNDAFWQRTSERSVVWVRDHFDIAQQTRRLEQIYDECLN